MTDPELIEKNLALGEHVKKGEFTFPLIPSIIVMHPGLIGRLPISRSDLPCFPRPLSEIEVLAMLSLKKFRHLRRSYYPDDGPR